MNVDLTAMPMTIDMAHAGLALLCLILLVLWLTKRGKASAGSEIEVESKVAVVPVKDVPQLKASSPDSALQLLALLQQDGRFIDFVKEDLSGFSDADIGVAARVVHEGSQKVLENYFTLSPVREETEESQLTLAEGFDAAQVRLTGNVVGSAPFVGVLVHRGWKAEDVNLPKLSPGHNVSIIAAAEVEL